jgi:uncharacterized protein YwqG
MESKLLSLIESEGLSRRASELLGLAKASITLQPRLTDRGRLHVGLSKFGGTPDLPATAEWPMWKGQPLAFIAQVRMADTARYRSAHVGPEGGFLFGEHFRMTATSRYDPTHDLPESGFLFFFYDPLQSVWGFDPGDREAWRVLYFDGPEAELCSRPLPAYHTEDETVGPDLEFNEFAIEFSRGLSLPPWESSDINALHFTEDELNAYFRLLRAVAEMNHGSAVRHRLLGYPDQIQGDMQLECQLVSHGLYCGNSSGYQDPRRAALEAGVKDWQLLLQIASDDDLGMMWGDVGCIYYWIRQEDLGARSFEKVWFSLQCT